MQRTFTVKEISNFTLESINLPMNDAKVNSKSITIENVLDLYFISDVHNSYWVEFLDVIALLAILSGILTIVSKNSIVSVLFLISLFTSIACYLVLIGIKFIGLSYLLVYVGAVSILFLFILMLINIRISELVSDTNNNVPLALFVIIAFFIPLSRILPDNNVNIYNTQNNKIFYVTSNTWDGSIVDVTDIMSIGNVMYTSYSIWLLVTSIILLLAMIGSIVITIK